MLYREFLSIANVSEDDVSVNTYDTIIEPMYMASKLDKRDFVAILNIDLIKSWFPNVNTVKAKIVELVADMRRGLGHFEMIDEENELVELAKQFCKLNNYEFCQMACVEYEYPVSQRGCTMYTGFTCRSGNQCRTYRVFGGDLALLETWEV